MPPQYVSDCSYPCTLASRVTPTSIVSSVAGRNAHSLRHHDCSRPDSYSIDLKASAIVLLQRSRVVL